MLSGPVELPMYIHSTVVRFRLDYILCGASGVVHLQYTLKVMGSTDFPTPIRIIDRLKIYIYIYICAYL